MAYVESVSLQRVLPCLAAPGRIIVIGKPSSPLDEVIPYLATLPGVIAYNPERSTLTFRRQPGFITLEPVQVVITQVKDVDQGLELLSVLTEGINSVWDHRTELMPATKYKRAPGLLDLWTLLPRTNCGECGERSCLAFAAGLVQQQRVPQECLALQSDAEAGTRMATLSAML